MRNDLEYVCHQLYELVTDGDGDMEGAFEIMRKHGFIDFNSEWVYEDEDE